ncbi:MAG: DUF4150 domain-containing protein [Novosphingobium sp.]|nr:DUF4150 domain-containing protein [Novosphingobium sp.]
MSKEPKLTELTEDDLDKVTGAGDPVPYPDIGGGETSGDSTKVKLADSTEGSTASAGNDAGSSKGVVSGVNSSKSSWSTPVSLDVKVEGKNIMR